MYSSRAYTSIARSYVRHFAGRNRRMRRSNNNKRGAKASATTIADDAPLLSHTLRKLYFLVHPDRTAMHPEVSERNTESMSELTGFLDDITSAERTASTQTNRKMRRLDFYVPAEEPAVEDAATSAGPDLDAATTRATRMPHRLKQELRALPLEELRERVAVSGPRLPACLASSCRP